MVETHGAAPADLKRAAVARAQVGRIEAAGDGRGEDHGLEFRVGAARAPEGPAHLGEAALDVVDQVGAPAQALDPEVLAGLEHGVIDVRAVLDGTAQLVGQVSGHADAADLHGLAGDPRLAEPQEPDVGEALARGALQGGERGRARHLGQVTRRRPRLDPKAGFPQHVMRPGQAGEEAVLVFVVALGDGVGRDQPVLGAHHRVLHDAHRERLEAVDADRREEGFDVRPDEIGLGVGKPGVDVAAGLP